MVRLLQVGEKDIHDCFLVNGDIGSHHGSAEPVVPRCRFGTAAQAKPVLGRKPLHTLEIVIPVEPPWPRAAVEDTAGGPQDPAGADAQGVLARAPGTGRPPPRAGDRTESPPEARPPPR